MLMMLLCSAQLRKTLRDSALLSETAFVQPLVYERPGAVSTMQLLI